MIREDVGWSLGAEMKVVGTGKILEETLIPLPEGQLWWK